jgi:pimeloyl-ACP methyl ester carboxylesterase/DNA-binding SARP family transcriptional activator
LNNTVNIQLLGDFRVFDGENVVGLPKSKKTRALLAYLIITDRPQRRERLCEIFWSTSEDPKATLRWSLSQLKKVAKQTGCDFLDIDRERVRVKSGALRSDLEKLYIANNLRELDLNTVAELALQANDTLLAGLDLPNLHDYSAWLAGERDKAVDLREALILAYIHSPSFSAEDKIKYAKIWLELRPLNTDAATLLLALLKNGNRVNEHTSWAKILGDRFREASIAFDANKEISAQAIDPFTEEEKLLSKQKINFCQTPDGHSLAYASIGNGRPLFKAANWLSHLELDWSAPIWSPIFKELSRDFQFIRYDERGNGLSDWNVKELSQATFVQDLETIIEQFQYEQFPLLGISQGVAVCIDYAIAHPERVTKLVLFGGYPKGWRVDATPEVTALREAMMTLTRDGWGKENPAYRHVFSSTFMPTATPEQLSWFDDFQRHTTSPENAVRFLEAFADIDVREKLSQIKVPTLVIHSKGDQRIDWTVARDMAAEIPNAELVTLDSDNHLLLDGEAAADKFIQVVRRFLLG